MFSTFYLTILLPLIYEGVDERSEAGGSKYLV